MMANVDTCNYIQVGIIIVKNVLSCSQRLLFRNVDIERFEIISSLISHRFSRLLRAELSVLSVQCKRISERLRDIFRRPMTLSTLRRFDPPDGRTDGARAECVDVKRI